jgi:hypothetical protein
MGQLDVMETHNVRALRARSAPDLHVTRRDQRGPKQVKFAICNELRGLWNLPREGFVSVVRRDSVVLGSDTETSSVA